MTQQLLTIVFLLLPGVVSAIICDKTAVHSRWGYFKFSIYSALFGVCAYVIVQISVILWAVLKHLCGFGADELIWDVLPIWSATISQAPSIDFQSLVFASLISVPQALLATYLVDHKVLNKFARKLGVTTKYGDENLFSYYLNAENFEWVYVRDTADNLTYQGKILAFSENDSIQEIVLSDVTVYRYEDSAELYSVPTIYLSKATGEFTLEQVPHELLGGDCKNE